MGGIYRGGSNQGLTKLKELQKMTLEEMWESLGLSVYRLGNVGNIATPNKKPGIFCGFIWVYMDLYEVNSDLMVI